MRIIRYSKNKEKEIIEEAVKTLTKGGLVVFPSDTVYGFLADATNESAVRKLIEVKRRPFGKPISVFLPSFESIDFYVEVNEKQREILRKLLPGPFTIVLPSKHKVCSLLESEKGTLGIRLPDYEPVNRLVKEFNKPVTATSANISGRGPHYTVEAFLKTLSEKKKKMIDLIVDAGKLPFNKPSTVIDLTAGFIKVLRKGDVMLEKIDEFVSSSPSQTRKIARFLTKKYFDIACKKGLFVFLEGELGVGKTEFVKGAGKLFEINEIISPTFVGYYEYIPKTKSCIKKLVHFDLYNIEDERELEYYNLPSFAKPGYLVFIEWAGRIKGFIPELKKKAEVLYIKLSYMDEKTRVLKIFQSAK